MRIWIVNHYAYAPSHSAGTRHFAMAKRLIERGHEVTIVSTSFFHKTNRETRLAPGQTHLLEVVDGVPFLWLRTPAYRGNSFGRLRNMIAFAWRVWRECGLRNLPNPDVVLGSSPSLLAAWAAKYLACRRGARFVLEIRDLWPETLVSLGAASDRHPLVILFRWIERDLYRSADRIVTVLPGSANYIATHGGRQERIECVPNGIDLDLAPEVSEPPKGDNFTVMYAGAHGTANALDTALDAAKILQERTETASVRFVLIGDGPEKRRLESRASNEAIRNIQFRPPTPKTEIHRSLANADAFLMILEDSPVFRWGISPNKLYDYLAMARPVVFSVSTRANPVRSANCGITLNPGDAIALANGIQDLASLPFSERRAMGLRGRKYVENEHDWRVLGKRLEELLQRAVIASETRRQAA